MSVLEKEFFEENVVKVNKLVQKILFFALVVPVLFFVLTKLHLWVVRDEYSLFLFIYTLIVAGVDYILNRNESTQYVSMYFGILAVSGFVDILGCNDIIMISISFCFGPLISCLYYNRKLSLGTSLVNFILAIFVYFIRAYTGTHPGMTALQYFVEQSTGMVIEYIFLICVIAALSKKTEQTLNSLISSKNERDNAYARLKERSNYIINTNMEAEEINTQLSETQAKLISFASSIVGSHDVFTGQHIRHTAVYVEIIAKELKSQGYYTQELTEKAIEDMKLAAELHDIGKIHIPEGILNKTGIFTNAEYDLMKSHPAEGKKILEKFPKIGDGSFNRLAIDMAYTHHEKWDGTGYPNGIKGEEIPLSGRIMAAADVLDALISKRLYKESMSVSEAMEIFRKASGAHFEPCITAAVISSQAIIELNDQIFKTQDAAEEATEISWWENYHKSLAQQDNSGLRGDFVGMNDN